MQKLPSNIEFDRKGVSAGGFRKPGKRNLPKSSQGTRLALTPPFLAGGHVARPMTQQGSTIRDYFSASSGQLIDQREGYENETMFQMTIENPQTQFNQIVPNNAFPQFQNKSDRLISAQLNQKHLKMFASRPETSKAVQNKYMELFNQPKNLFDQVLSISETQTQAKKFFTENRIHTATTRAESFNDLEQLAEMRAVLGEETHDRRNGNRINLATIDRAKTAFEQTRNGKKKVVEGNSNKKDIDQLLFPPRAGTAAGLLGSQQGQSYNDDVHLHIRRLKPPLSSLNIIPQVVEEQFSSMHTLQDKSHNQQNEKNQHKQQFESLTGTNFFSKSTKESQPNEQDLEIKDSKEKKGSLVVAKKNSKQNQKLQKIDYNDLQVSNNVARLAQKEFSAFTTPQDSVKLPEIKVSNQKDENVDKTKNQEESLVIDTKQQSVDQTVEELNMKTDELTQGELKYIQKKGKVFMEDIRPHLERIQKSNPAELESLNEQAHYYSQLALGIHQDKLPIRHQLSANHNHEIFQENIVEPEKCFYDHPANIHQSLKVFGQELREKFDKLNSDDEIDFKKFQETKESCVYNFLNATDESISIHEVELVKEEYKKPPESRNYEFLGTIAERLKFFQNFTKPTRIYLLKLAQVQEYPANKIIFNQGDEGDLMYVIIRGACHVRINRISSDGTEDSQVVATLYDGTQFGELALMNVKKSDNLIKTIKMNEAGQVRLTQIRSELDKQPLFKSSQEQEDDRKAAKDKEEKEEERRNKYKDYENEDDSDLEEEREKKRKVNEEDLNKILEEASMSSSKRAATIETCEHTILFTVSRDYFKTILLGLIQKELDSKLKLLQSLSFFEYNDLLSLIPLANLVEVKKYKLGEIVLREGQEPDSFFIVSSGRFKIIKEELVVRSNFAMGRDHQFSTKNLSFGMIDYTKVSEQKGAGKKNEIVDNAGPTASDLHAQLHEDMENSEAPPKSSNYETVYENDQNIAYRYQNDFGSLVRSDFFFGRSLLLEYLKVDPIVEENYTTDPREKAKLTVIADSAQAEVFVLQKYQIHLIPNLLRRMLIEGLIVSKEYDAIYTKEVKQWSKQWEKYKSDMLEKMKSDQLFKKPIKS